jgi:hypothetical protein
MLRQLPHQPGGFAVVDPKGDLFSSTLLLMWERIEELRKHDPVSAQKLQSRVVIVDFSAHDPATSYNILSAQRGLDSDFFASSRADLLLDLLPAGDGLSMGASTLLTKIILLLAEFGLPVTVLSDVIYDDQFRDRLLHRSRQPDVVAYFTRQFIQLPRQTVAALARRTDSLFSSESVKCALSGPSAPSLSALQDSGQILLVNCWGENISRSVRQLLHAIVFSDIAQSIFSRKRRDVPYLVIADEAQHFFSTPKLRDHVEDVLSLSRSFGTFLCSITQSLATAVHDTRLLHTLQTNVRWSFSLRGEPSECAFLKPAFPASGRKPQPQPDPFKEPTYYTLNDERAAELNAVAHLPDRTGWFWYRPHSSEAIKISTSDVTLPTGQVMVQSMQKLMGDPNFGARLSRQEYELHLTKQKKTWKELPSFAKLDQTLAETYKRVRGKKQ